MHDLLVAKEAIDEVIKNANKNNLKKVTKVVIELGNKEYSHGSTSLVQHGSPQVTIGGDHAHLEAIDPENLEFNLKLIAKNTIAENAEFIIKKSDIPDILVKEIEGE